VSRTAVQFGAGNIGRGFLAQLFHESGLEVVFVEVAPGLVEALNRERAYTIRIVGPGAREVRITGVRAVDGRDSEAVAQELAACQIACTAVGAAALPRIVPNLARGLLLRHARSAPPLNILICENLHGADAHVRSLVEAHLPAAEAQAILTRTGFVQAVVSRMVPLQESRPEEPLSLRVEAYKRLPVDAAAVAGQLPPIAGVEPVAGFQAHVERKLYTHNCAHAALGYLGWLRGVDCAHLALEEPVVRETLDAVLAETGTALIARHGFDPQEHRAHVADLLTRFANAELGDTCFRLARDPLRKLAPDDRLVGAARLCESQGIVPAAVARVIGAALRFDSPEDPSAVALQRRLREEGLDRVLEDVCGIDPGEPLGRAVKAAWTSW